LHTARITRVLLTLSAVFVGVKMWAGDPWKEKQYKNWDAQDVQKILTASPWSKPVEIERTKERKLDLEAPEGAPKIKGAHENEDEKEGGAGKKEDDEDEESGPGRGKIDEAQRRRGNIKFLVRWISSRTLREASVRGQVLQGKIAEAQMDKYLPAPSDDYELALVGTDMNAFQNAQESALKSRSFLIAKRSKEKINASQVEIVTGGYGKRINAIIFHLPKTNATGQAAVSPEEKEIKFVTRAGSSEVKAVFDPQKMADMQGMDL
jgi:hypothetical protein